MSAQIDTLQNATLHPTSSSIRTSTRFVKGVLTKSPNKQTPPQTNNQDPTPPDNHPHNSKNTNKNGTLISRSPGKKVEQSEKKSNVEPEPYRMQAEMGEGIPKVEKKAMGVIGSIFINSTTKYMKTPSVASAAKSSPASKDNNLSPAKKDAKVNITKPNPQTNKVQVKAAEPKSTPVLSPAKKIDNSTKQISKGKKED